MQLSLAFRFWSACAPYQGETLVSVWANISSLALEYSTHLLREVTSMALNFPLRVGSLNRSRNLFSCSSSLTENQYLINMIPDWRSISSKRGHDRRNSQYSSSVQKPITLSTPALLYQLRR